MTLARATPYLVLVVLVIGITVVFLVQDAESPTPASPPGPLTSLAPILRGLEERETAETDAGILVLRAMDGVLDDPRPVIREALAHEDWAVQWAGLLAIPRYGESDADLAQALKPLLGVSQARIRAGAARAAGYLRESDLEPVVEDLVARFEDEDARVRGAALATMARRSAMHPELVPAWLEALEDEVAACRVQAARGLSQIELQEKLESDALASVRDALLAVLEDPSEEVRIYVVMALGRTGSAAAPAIPQLVALLDDDDPLLRGQAATTLGSIGAAALPALEEALAADDGTRAPSLLWALRLMGEPGRPALRRARDTRSPLVRVLAAQQLWELGDDVPTAVQVLTTHVGHADVAVQLVAIRILGRMGTEGASAIPALEQLADHEDERVVEAAARAAERLRQAGK